MNNVLAACVWHLRLPTSEFSPLFGNSARRNTQYNDGEEIHNIMESLESYSSDPKFSEEYMGYVRLKQALICPLHFSIWGCLDKQRWEKYHVVQHYLSFS